MIGVVYVAAPPAAAAAQIGGRRRGNVAANSIVVALIAIWLFSSPAWVVSSSSSLTSHVERDGETQDLAGAGSAAALMEFKTSLVSSQNGGAVERALISWNLSTSPCAGNVGNWYGVRCFNGDVMGLQLDNLNLSGDIDVDALVPLRFLRILSFENNNFEGLMPDWRKLGALKSLFLSNNRFSGQIADDAFSSMGSLKKVHLANNKFIGKIPSSLATTPRLLELRLENNGFTGQLPEFRTGLKLFNASNNQLEGPIPPALSSLDPSAFSVNKGLCGKPLKSSCNAPPKSSPQASSGGATDAETLSSSSLSKILMIVAICLLAVAVLISLIIICRGRQDNSQAVDKGALDPLFSPYNNPGTSTASGGTNTAAASPSPDRAMGGSTPSNNGNSRAGDSTGASPSVGKLAFMRTDRTQFDLQDLLRASAEVLGTGNLGSSYKAVLMDGQSVVVKRFKHMNQVEREDFHEHMRRIARLEHPNLLPLVAYYYRKEEKLLISDFIPSGSLATHLHGKDSGLDWATRLKIIKGVAKALAYLHRELASLVLPHGHLKSSNVLLDKSFNPIVMDYALVPVVNPDDVPNLLAAYKSPEYTNLHRPTRKTDVWTLGILILETLTATSPAKYQDSDLRTWVGSIAAREAEVGDDDDGGDQAETLFDVKMAGDVKGSRGQMRKLLKIGVGCCQEDPETRLELKEAVERIEILKERDDQ